MCSWFPAYEYMITFSFCREIWFFQILIWRTSVYTMQHWMVVVYLTIDIRKMIESPCLLFFFVNLQLSIQDVIVRIFSLSCCACFRCLRSMLNTLLIRHCTKNICRYSLISNWCLYVCAIRLEWVLYAMSIDSGNIVMV